MDKVRHVGVCVKDDFTLELMRVTYGRGPKRYVALTLVEGFKATKCEVWGLADPDLLDGYNASIPNEGRMLHVWTWLKERYREKETLYNSDLAGFGAYLRHLSGG